MNSFVNVENHWSCRNGSSDNLGHNFPRAVRIARDRRCRYGECHITTIKLHRTVRFMWRQWYVSISGVIGDVRITRYVKLWYTSLPLKIAMLRIWNILHIHGGICRFAVPYWHICLLLHSIWFTSSFTCDVNCPQSDIDWENVTTSF